MSGSSTARGVDQGAVRLATFRRLARLFDSCITIPGTDIRVGLDPIIGLVPGVGDIVGALWSAYLIYLARHLDLPASTIRRMWFNVAIDTALGAVPVLGDLFDFYWDANQKNKALVEQYLDRDECDN